MFDSPQNVPGTYGDNAPFEGKSTTKVEKYTSQAPSMIYLIGAGVCFAGAATLIGMKQEKWGFLVGQLTPAFLLMGVYNKIVKLASAEQLRGRAI